MSKAVEALYMIGGRTFTRQFSGMVQVEKWLALHRGQSGFKLIVTLEEGPHE